MASPKGYPKEFREDAVRLYRSSGKSVATVAKELGIAVESLRKWIKQVDLDSGRPQRRTDQRGARRAASAASREPGAARGARDPEARQNFTLAETKRLIVREQRTFVEMVEGTFGLPSTPVPK